MPNNENTICTTMYYVILHFTDNRHYYHCFTFEQNNNWNGRGNKNGWKENEAKQQPPAQLMQLMEPNSIEIKKNMGINTTQNKCSLKIHTYMYTLYASLNITWLLFSSLIILPYDRRKCSSAKQAINKWKKRIQRINRTL